MPGNVSRSKTGPTSSTDGNDSFLVTTACFLYDDNVGKFRMFFDLIKAFAICTKTGLK